MPSNALLVRWSGGWAEVADGFSIDTHGRREALLGLGAAQSLVEVNRVASMQLAVYADPRTEIKAGLEPIDASDAPYAGFGVGDRITVPDATGTPTEERVMSVTVSMDENGHITYAPDLKDVILSDRERWEQALKKMTGGTMRGSSKVATPAGLIANRSVPLPIDGGGGET